MLTIEFFDLILSLESLNYIFVAFAFYGVMLSARYLVTKKGI